MIADLKPYPAMKESAVPWLTKVPEHWDTPRLKTIFREVDRRSGTGEEPLLSLRMQRGLVDHHATGGTPIQPSSLVHYKRTEPDDIVMNRMRAAAGLFAVTPTVGLVSPDYAVLRPRTLVDVRYFVYLFRTPLMMSVFRVESRGLGTGESGFLRLYAERFGMLAAPVPPSGEQAAIVRFLDHADRRIRRYLRAKQKLIKLMEEQKDAIIHRAVTRGLDPNVSLKPSGVEWLGEMPERWEVAALRHRYSQVLGKMLDSKRIVGDQLLPYLRNTDVQWDRINIENLPTMDIAPDEYERYTLQNGDLLVCEGGEVGRCAIWANELGVCGFQKALHRLRPRKRERDDTRFLYYSLRAACLSNAFNDGHVSTIAHLTGDKLRAHQFAFPPIETQQAIVRALDEVSARVDGVVRVAQREVTLLHEFRTRLIADVVTGKLDVREAAAGLPEVTEEFDELAEPDSDLEDEPEEDSDVETVTDEAEG